MHALSRGLVCGTAGIDECWAVQQLGQTGPPQIPRAHCDLWWDQWWATSLIGHLFSVSEIMEFDNNSPSQNVKVSPVSLCQTCFRRRFGRAASMPKMWGVYYGAGRLPGLNTKVFNTAKDDGLYDSCIFMWFWGEFRGISHGNPQVVTRTFTVWVHMRLTQLVTWRPETRRWEWASAQIVAPA